MVRNIIQCELRPVKDDDIAKALEKAITVETSRSSIIRKALRQYLFKNTPLSTQIPQIIQSPTPNPLPIEKSSHLPIELPHIELQPIEKDDTHIDDALNKLFNF